MYVSCFLLINDNIFTATAANRLIIINVIVINIDRDYVRKGRS